MHPATRADRLAAALDEFVRSSPDVEAAAVVSFDGLPMASALPEDLEEDRLGAMSAALLSLGEQAALGLGRGELNQVFVEGEHGFVFLMSARDQAVLTAVASRNAKIGFMLYEMRRAADNIGAALESDEPHVVAPEAVAPGAVAPEAVATGAVAAENAPPFQAAPDAATPNAATPFHAAPDAEVPLADLPPPPAFSPPAGADTDATQHLAEVAATAYLEQTHASHGDHQDAYEQGHAHQQGHDQGHEQGHDQGHEQGHDQAHDGPVDEVPSGHGSHEDRTQDARALFSAHAGGRTHLHATFE